MIGKVIYGRLTTDAAVTGICGLNIFPDIAPQNVQYPFMVYTIINSLPVDFKDGQSNLEEITLQIDVYTNKHAEWLYKKGYILDLLDIRDTILLRISQLKRRHLLQKYLV